MSKENQELEVTETLNRDETLRLRKTFIGGSCTLFFKSNPIKIVKGKGQYMYDEKGKKYLDCINNVAHVGHCHPDVVAAGSKQMATLSTNSRYLHDNLVVYAQRLVNYFPNKLSVCYFVNSGSEANDLAMRLARAHSGHKDFIILDGAYHGHLTSMTDISPYKFLKMKNGRKKNWVHVAPLPCSYRGMYQSSQLKDADLGQLYADEVKKLIDNAHSQGRKVAGFMAESMVSCGGQVVLPDSYLRNVYKYVRAAGGLCMADEVQTGFGRIGTHMWAFQHYGEDVIPDIVMLGKPIGNGHPVAAVVTTNEIARSFEDLGVEYFNTYGGNPVSLAITSAVLDVIEKEKLRDNAIAVGNFLKNALINLMDRHPLIGDVRGMGMFVGIDLVSNRTTKEPAVAESELVIKLMKERYILISTEGKYGNVLKFKPPMVFNMEDARTLVKALDEVLGEVEESSGLPKPMSEKLMVNGNSELSNCHLPSGLDKTAIGLVASS